MRSFARPNYFAGEFLAVADYRAEQAYQDGLRQRHDGGLHTWGIASGLQVALSGDGTQAIVQPGLAVDPAGQLVRVDAPLGIALATTLPSTLVLKRVEEVVAPTRPGALPRLVERAGLEWVATAGEGQLALALLSAGPTLDATIRRYAGLAAGMVRFAMPYLEDEREPALVGWSTPTARGLRISAASVVFAPVSGQATQLGVVGGQVGIGTLAPHAALEIHAPNAPLAGSGTLSSRGVVVTASDPDFAKRVSVGDTLLTRTRQGSPAESTVAKILSDGRVETTSPLETDGASWELLRRKVLTLSAADGTPLLVGDVSATVQLGGDDPSNDARLRLWKGAQDANLRFEGDGRQLAFEKGGRITSGTAHEIRFDERANALVLRDAGDIQLSAGATSSATPPGLYLAASGNVGLGTLKPDNPLTIEGPLYATGGYVFPDGSLQTTPEVSIPIGAVIDWWRPSVSVQIPDEYRICDGSTVDDPASPLNGHALPDLNNRFIVGTTDPTKIGPSGSDSHQHGYVVPEHDHPFPHKHPDFTGVSGQANDGEGDADEAASQFCDDGHVHPFTATIPASATTNTQSNSDVNTQATTQPASLLPPYVGLLKLIRIR